MFDTSPKAIEKYIEEGESQRVGFKTRLPKKDVQLERLLSSFANTEGGLLLIGIDGQGELQGVPDRSVGFYMSRLERVSEKLFSWPIEIGVVDLNDKTLVYAAIDAAPHTLAPIKTSDGRVFFRMGNKVQSPTHQEERQFYGVIQETESGKAPSLTKTGNKNTIIFLSYAREDLKLVQQLYTRLRKAELNPWMDKPPPPYELDGIPFGQDWEEVVKGKLTKARIVLALLSSQSVEKMGFIQKEFRIALGLQAMRPSGSVYLIPTLLEDCEPPAYSVENISFSHLQWYRLHEDGDLTLIRYLQNITGISMGHSERTVAESFGINVYDLKSRQRMRKRRKNG